MTVSWLKGRKLPALKSLAFWHHIHPIERIFRSHHMNVRERELVPTRSQMPLSRDFLVHRNDEMNPLLILHREMNRVFEEVFRGAFYDPATVPFDRHGIEQGSGWPHI